MARPDPRPNYVIILADDMGFSDIGAYGSEIKTPNLDRLAATGLTFTQMYNYARCCPSRAALLTGLSPHRAGIGHMVNDLEIPGYEGYLNRSCVTIAEALLGAGYQTLMSGKWHVGGNYNLRDRASWSNAGDERHPLPTQRGFEAYYGILGGAASFFAPLTLMRGETFVDPEGDDYYFTDAITEEAVRMIEAAAAGAAPFLLYLAYTAPHWPLHAYQEDIARYEGVYRSGWDVLRTARHEELKGKGILDKRWPISPRDPFAPPWGAIPNAEWESLRMAVYAAQIDRMDQGIGRVMAKLAELGLADDTCVAFMSDNGGCAEFLAEDTPGPVPSQWDVPTRDGRAMRIGNVDGLRPGPDDTFMSYDLPWANASNAPFRLYKHWVHEGGISTPFIVHWPARVTEARIVHEPVQIMDIMATCLDAAGASYPSEYEGHPIHPLEGESFLDLIDGKAWSRHRPLVWEHEGNCAVRAGQWKLVRRFPERWELYDTSEDRTELNDLAPHDAPRVARMAELFDEWAASTGVADWPVARLGPNVFWGGGYSMRPWLSKGPPSL